MLLIGLIGLIRLITLTHSLLSLHLLAEALHIEGILETIAIDVGHLLGVSAALVEYLHEGGHIGDVHLAVVVDVVVDDAVGLGL